MKKNTHVILILILIFLSGSLFAQRQFEKLNRGLVAVKTSTSSVFLSWRVLGSDPDNVAFNLYRDGVKINATPITTSTNYTDPTASATTYTVKTVINNIETGETNSASVWSNNYLEIPMNVPAAMTMPDGTTCTYSPNDCSVGDVDGDGEFELVVKWDPSNSKDNSQSGYTGDVYLDVYKLNGTQLCRIDLGKNIRAGAHYTDFEVDDFDGNGKAEIICKTAPGTKDGLGNFLSKGPAASDNDAADYRTTAGYILSGPEYLTCFSGLTGEELSTVNYVPARGTISSWGDSYGNRVDRFLACTAYLDGVHPSAVMCRGYYTRVVLATWDFRNGQLTQRWVYDSNTPNGANAYGQGNHNLSVGDIDDDGKDEIVYGASAFDDDGKCMYATGLGHGDAMHMSDLDPDRKGLEVWEMHESTSAAYGEEMHDAKTGAILWGNFTGSDNGRGVAANIIPGNRGFEMWSASGNALWNKAGLSLNSSKPSMNFRIYWDGDLQDELLDNISITKWGAGTLLTANGCNSNNSTKATPNLSADILGDWREELVLRTADNTKLRIYTTTIPTTYKMYTLMHDAQYRDAVAWQNTAYNQPPHCGFYIGDDMQTEPVSAIYNNEKRWSSGTTWDNNSSASWTDSTSTTSTFKNGDGVLFDITAGANALVNVSGNLTPRRVKVNSPFNVEVSGNGTLTGSMDLKKIGAGSLKLNNNNSYTGSTDVWDGDFYNNGVLSNSGVTVYAFVKLAGNGTFGKAVTLGNLSSIDPGNTVGESSKMTFLDALTEVGAVSYTFDFNMSAGKVIANDTLKITGDWTLSGQSTFNINLVGGSLPVGNYILAHCSGSLNGDLTKIKVKGVPAYLSYLLTNINGDIVLKVNAPSVLIWNGNVDTKWDNGITANWMLDELSKIFVSNDSVVFNDNTTSKAVVVNGSVIPGKFTIDAASNYTFSGSGSIDGPGSFLKSGTGKVVITTQNNYTGKTTINEGTVEFANIAKGGSASAIGAASNLPSNIVLNGGKLSYTGFTTSIDRGFTLGQNGGTLSIGSSSTVLATTGKITGPGALIKDGSGRLSLSVGSDYSGGTTIKLGSIALTSDIANTTGLGSDTITFMGGSLVMYDSNTTDNTSNWNLSIPSGKNGGLYTDGRSLINGSISGSGTLNYYTNYTGNILASDVSQFSGIMNITTDADGGNFVVYNTKGYESAKINLSNLVTMLYRGTSNLTIPIGDLTGYSNSVLGAGGAGACTITWEVGARNANSTFSGIISNAQYSGAGAIAAINKVGIGTWTLTNANTFSGGTNINNGILMVNNTAGSGLGTGNNTVNSGGTLAGTGSVTGVVSVLDGGVLSPGNGVGTFTINNYASIFDGGTLLIDIDKTNSKNDLLNVTGTLTMAGKLQISALNNTVFNAGDSFKLINGNVIGTPTEIIPATPGDGLDWDLSEFNTSGTLKVKVSTGLNDLRINGKVYPNPFTNTLNIQLDQTVQKIQLNIVNLIGEVVYSTKYSDISRFNLNLDALTKGVYLLQIKADENIISKKIVKE